MIFPVIILIACVAVWIGASLRLAMAWRGNARLQIIQGSNLKWNDGYLVEPRPSFGAFWWRVFTLRDPYTLFDSEERALLGRSP